MTKLKIIDYILIIEVVIIVGMLTYVIVRPDQPCTLTFEIQKGRNFDQPYPVYTHCSNGGPATVIGNIHGDK